MPSKSSLDRRVVIPQHIQEALNQHMQMQQNVPAHLKKYTQEGHGYIPQHAQEAIAQQMQQNVPAHLKKYVDAYVQQRVADPHLRTPSVLHQSTPQFSAPAPANLQSRVMVPHLPRQDHFHPSEDLGSVQPVAAPQPVFQAAAYPVVPGQPQPQPLPPQEQPIAPVPVFQPGQTVAPTPQPLPQQPSGSVPPPLFPPGPAQPAPQPYDFITNANQAPPQRELPSIPGVSPKAMRAAFMAGGLLVLLIAFIVVKGLLSSSPNLTPFVGVGQDQQELIHLATNAGQLQGGIDTSNQNFAATAQLSLTSSQAALIQYLANNGKKVSANVLSLKISSSTDTQLTNAASAATYDQTFQQIMKTQLTTYLNDLQQSYKQTTGKKGRALLSSSFQQGQLLLTQLNEPAQ